ncbi:MAG: hypothetical protein EDS66_16205 [Planctomycetota bacterium]|nr:MAG: hypothetical protein EDS66_16205 [Planctomycetota bacterium]
MIRACVTQTETNPAPPSMRRTRRICGCNSYLSPAHEVRIMPGVGGRTTRLAAGDDRRWG